MEQSDKLQVIWTVSIGACVQVVVLVGTGWSYMTPFLRDREKRLLMVVIPLQVWRCHWHCYKGFTDS